MTRTLTHSSGATLHQCAWKYYLRYGLGIVRLRTDSAPRIGSMFHEGIAEGEPVEQPDTPNWAADEAGEYTFQSDHALASAMTRAYLTYWADEVFLDSEAEIEFCLPQADGWERRGKTDRVVTLRDGRVALVETKTTADKLTDSTYWRKLLLDAQVSNYVLALQDMGIDVDVVIYDVIHRPGTPKRIAVLDGKGYKTVLDPMGVRVYTKAGKPRQTGDKKRGWAIQTRRETLDEYEQRTYQTMLDAPEAHFVRREIARKQVVLDAFRGDLNDMVSILDFRYENDVWEHNFGACWDYFKECPYYELCLEGWNGGELPLGYDKRRAHEELSDGGK